MIKMKITQQSAKLENQPQAFKPTNADPKQGKLNSSQYSGFNTLTDHPSTGTCNETANS